MLCFPVEELDDGCRVLVADGPLPRVLVLTRVHNTISRSWEQLRNPELQSPCPAANCSGQAHQQITRMYKMEVLPLLERSNRSEININIFSALYFNENVLLCTCYHIKLWIQHSWIIYSHALVLVVRQGRHREELSKKNINISMYISV